MHTPEWRGRLLYRTVDILHEFRKFSRERP
jgi:hypothetical protein